MTATSATMSRSAAWLARTRQASPALLLTIVLAAGFIVRPSPVWAMIFYLTVLPVFLLGITRREAWPADAGSLASIALLAWFTLGTAWDHAAGTQVGPHAIWVWNGLCTLVFVVVARTEFGAPGIARERLIVTLIAAALVNTSIILARTALTGLEPDGRLAGWAETRHPILGACVIGTCVVLAAGRLLSGASPRWMPALCAATVLAGVTFIIMTGSRGPLVAIAGALGLLLAMTRPRLLAAAIAAGLILLAVLAVADPGVLQHAWARLLERGWSSRLDIWRLALDEISRRPLFGYGPSARLDRAIDNFPHNLLLSTLFYSGTVGFALLLAVLGLAVRGAMRQPDRTARASTLALLLHLVLSGMTDLSQVTKGPGPLWYIIWIPVILALGPPRRIHLAERSVG